MKKKLVIMAGLMLMTTMLFSACDKKNADNNATAEYHVHTDENGETYTHKNDEVEETSENNKAITGEEAVEKIKKFSAKKLGLDGKKKNYTFLASTETKEIEEKECFEVIASVMTKNEKDEMVSIDTKGTYYVSADGKECFIKNMKTGEIKKLK